jgi:hypothetical protein
MKAMAKDHLDRLNGWFDRRLPRPLSLLACLVFLIMAHMHVTHGRRHRALEVLQWDIGGYHHYLPGAIIYRDLKDLAFLDHRIPAVRQHPELATFGLTRSEVTGHYYNKFTYGVALMNLPAFLLAHAWVTWVDPTHPADGYSEPYQHAVAISCYLFAFAGLMLLRKFLSRYFGDLHIALALLAIGIGTNLYFYSTHNAGMAHAYLFFLFALILERTDHWHRHPSWQAATVLGLAIGVVAITRPVDSLIILVPLLWNTIPRDLAAARWKLVRRYRWHLVAAGVALVLPLLPQFFYWKATTGSWIFYSYTGEGFAFAWSKISSGLFSYRKGWFLYTPLAALMIAALIAMASKRVMKGMVFPLLVFFPLFILIVFSWHQWWYGGGFGARPMIEGLALLALPLAWLSQFAMSCSRILWLGLCLVVYMGIELNLLQQFQYAIGMLHYEDMTAERYWEIFLKRDWEGLREFPY